ncbi:hypothetical protein [Sulfurimonas sp.]|uniref:hypothetical protein n=1 Tax=Sulfurimonas sp. TaxID=2022749 RepID=UPI0025FA4561|nr:hypothetical protein [Sulfurimonas sp.]MDD5158199.1 hypothetical protein [Sulfurimonas sp.]
MKKVILIVISSAIALFFSACGAKEMIVIPSYTAPNESAKLSKIETKNEVFSKKGAYLALWLNPKVDGEKKTNPALEKMLINSVKASLTQTNFIAIDPLGGDEGVALNMSVLNYDYKKTKTTMDMYLEVSFTLTRGTDEFLVKTYNEKKSRFVNTDERFPTENELASEAVSKVVKFFISDISPLKTHQLREFKSLPSELVAVAENAKRKNYKGAIQLMNRYKGSKDMSFYYNLAVLYEAEASTTENLKLLRNADINYEKAIELGGKSDSVVISAKARFDNFYDLLSKTKKQDEANQALKDDRSAMLGSSDKEYE